MSSGLKEHILGGEGLDDDSSAGREAVFCPLQQGERGVFREEVEDVGDVDESVGGSREAEGVDVVANRLDVGECQLIGLEFQLLDDFRGTIHGGDMESVLGKEEGVAA